jgi:hypothetical protein
VAPGCETVNGWPATVSEPLRAAVPVFAAALKEIEPLPLPLAPDVTVSHDELLDADHAQPVPTVTVTVPLPPPTATVADAGEMTGVHTTGAEIVKVFESALSALPPGPVAATRLSYTIPGVSDARADDGNAVRMRPAASGAGFPSGTLTTTVVDPFGEMFRTYPLTSAIPSNIAA